MICGARPFHDKTEIARLAKGFEGKFALRGRAILVPGVRSGLRISEILSLRVRDVLDGAGRFRSAVYVRRAAVKGKKNGKSVFYSEDCHVRVLARQPFHYQLIGVKCSLSSNLGFAGNFFFDQRHGYGVIGVPAAAFPSLARSAARSTADPWCLRAPISWGGRCRWAEGGSSASSSSCGADPVRSHLPRGYPRGPGGFRACEPKLSYLLRAYS